MLLLKSYTETYRVSQSWSTDEEALKTLTGISTIVCKANTLHCDFSAYFWKIFAGGPLNRRVGDYLANEGVNLHSLYGS